MNTQAPIGPAAPRRQPKPRARREAGPPVVSVVVPVHDTEPYLAECLASVCAQSLAALQIIVVDDASSDGSLAVAERFAATDERIEIVRQTTRSGPSAARNAGARRAAGKYLFFLDSDDYLAADALAKLAALASDTGAEVTFCRGQQFLETGDWGPTFPPKLLYAIAAATPAEFTRFWVFMSAALALYDRQFLLRNDIQFDEDVALGEDRIFLSRCLPKAGSISAVGEELYFYRKRPGSLSNYDEFDGPRIADLLAYNQRVSDNYAAMPMVRQHYLLTYVNPQIAKLVALVHRGNGDDVQRLVEGMAGIFKGLDMALVMEPQRQPWRPLTIVPKRTLAVVEALAAGDPLRLRAALDDLSGRVMTAGVLAARDLLTTDPPAARKVARTEVSRDPSNAEAHLVLAEAWLRPPAAIDTAIKALVEAVRLDPADPEPHRALAVAFLRNGHAKSATVHIDKALHLSPGDARSLSAKAQIELALGNLDQAVAALRSEIESSPRSPGPYFAMARAFLAADRLGVASDVVREMWAKVPGLRNNRGEYWSFIAGLLHRGDGADAVHLLLTAHEPSPFARRVSLHVVAHILNIAITDQRDTADRFPAIDLAKVLGDYRAVLHRDKLWGLARAVGETRIALLAENGLPRQRAMAQMRVAESLIREGNYWSALRALKFAENLFPDLKPLAQVAVRASELAQHDGHCAAALEAALLAARTASDSALRQRIDKLLLQCSPEVELLAGPVSRTGE